MLRTCQIPLLMLVAMRSGWAEFNPRQVPMGQATRAVLEAMGVLVQRSDDPETLHSDVDAALRLAYSTYSLVAALLPQKLLGAKAFGGVK